MKNYANRSCPLFEITLRLLARTRYRLLYHRQFNNYNNLGLLIFFYVYLCFVFVLRFIVGWCVRVMTTYNCSIPCNSASFVVVATYVIISKSRNVFSSGNPSAEEIEKRYASLYRSFAPLRRGRSCNFRSCRRRRFVRLRFFVISL